MTDAKMHKWLNTAHLGRFSLSERSCRGGSKERLSDTLVSVQNWVREWTKSKTGKVGLSDSTTAACDSVLCAIVPDVEQIVHTNAAHPTIRNSVKAAAENVARIRRTSVPVIEIDVASLDLSSPANASSDLVSRVRSVTSGRKSLIVLEHVSFFDGVLIAVDEVATRLKKEDPHLKIVIDGAQAAGLWPAKADNFDAYLGCFHKFIAAPPATAFFVVRPEYAEHLPFAARAITEMPGSLSKMPTVDLEKWVETHRTLMKMERDHPLKSRRALIESFNERLHAALAPIDLTTGPRHYSTRSHISAIPARDEHAAQYLLYQLAASGYQVQRFGDVIRISIGLTVRPEWGAEVGQLIRSHLR